MATWPTSKPDSTKFDSDNDRISTSRPELKTMSDAVNDVVDFIQPSGITNGQGLVYDSGTATMIPGTVGSGDYHELTFSPESLSGTAGNPSGSPSIPVLSLSGTKVLHKVNFGSNTASGVTRYVDIELSALSYNPGVLHTVYLYGTVGATSQVGARLKHSGTIIDTPAGSTTYILGGTGINKFGFQVQLVDTAVYLVTWNNGTQIFL